MAGTPRKSTAQMASERRLAKLDAVREQVDRGTLVIRGMTDAERERYPPRPVSVKKRPR